MDLRMIAFGLTSIVALLMQHEQAPLFHHTPYLGTSAVASVFAFYRSKHHDDP